MKCKNCFREFFIYWKDLDDTTGTAQPIAVPFNYIDQFVDQLSKGEDVMVEMLSKLDKYDM